MNALIDGIRHGFVTADVSAFPALVAEDAEIRSPLATASGPEGFAALANVFADLFTDREIEILAIVESGDAALVEQRVSARHLASGRRIVFDEAAVIRIRDGRIASWRAYYDAAALDSGDDPGA